MMWRSSLAWKLAQKAVVRTASVRHSRTCPQLRPNLRVRSAAVIGPDSSVMSVVGTKLPIRDVRSLVAIEGEADIVRKVQFGSD
jgi:hypothetical protein